MIRDQVSRLPGKPGVYRMYGEAGELLYVGKARNLRARVSNYAKIGGQTQRIARMISLTRSMEFVVTASETEALLLEANLIKKLKPRFNIILRDDKSFPHILIREDHEAPQALNIAAQSGSRDSISALLLLQEPSIIRSIRCRKAFAAHVHRQCLPRRARGPVCCIRWAGVRRHASESFRWMSIGTSSVRPSGS